MQPDARHSSHSPAPETLMPGAMPDGAVRLEHWGVIRAQGADAATFLHGQLSNDFTLLGTQQARLAAYCSPKGRMLASFIGIKVAPDDLLLVCSRDLLAATLKRLSMFVLRAQCKLTDATDSVTLWGVTGRTADAIAAAQGLPAPVWSACAAPSSTEPFRAESGSTPNASEPSRLVRLPAAATPAPNPVTRLLWLAPAGAQPELLATAPAIRPDEWAWLDVLSGVAMVSAKVADAFVPQMLNYESVEGINFKKGCYPGQEVVARSQFRGTLKRRAFRAWAQLPAGVAADMSFAPGMEIFHSDDAEQPCGTVASVATAPALAGDPADTVRLEAMVSLQTSATQGGTLTLGSANGPALHLGTLPYPLKEDI